MKDFPLFKGKNGQWRKDVWDSKLKKSLPYYFGSIEADPKGEAALKEWVNRKDAIKAGLDKLRTGVTVKGAITVGDLGAQFMAAMRTKMVAGDMSMSHYGSIVNEVTWFMRRAGTGAIVNSILPGDFAVVARLLVEGDRVPDGKAAQGVHARKRIIAIIRAMFNWGAGNGLHNKVNFGTAFVAPETTPEAVRKSKMRAGVKDNSKRIVTGGEMDKLLDRSQAQFKAIVLLSVNTGMGPADLGRLRWWQLDLEKGHCPSLPRGKTGNDRAGYLWKKTRAALLRVRTLKHNAKAIAKDGENALVFISRKGLPMYRELEVVKDGRSVGVKIQNSISGTFSKMAQELGLEGVTQYRLRHTFKTLGKRARDDEALDYMMGHKDRSTGKVYDHSEIGTKRVKRVARVVYRRLWPKPKREAGTTGAQELRIAAA